MIGQISEKELPADGYRNTWKPLLLIVLLAIVLRVCWIVRQTAVIENEGAEYAQIAQNLVAGKGYVGLWNVPEVMFPPLYPILIAAFSLATRDFDLAARLVSLTIGTCLVLPVFFIALRMYGRRVAFISASMIAFHPLLIALSGSVYSEVVFLTVLMGGVYWGTESLRLEKATKVRNSILCGMCLGLAYLTRPEGIALPVLVCVAIILVALFEQKGPKTAAVACLLVLTSFAVVATPYVAFLSYHTGRFRVEGKSDIVFSITQRMNSGMNYLEATHGISRDLTDEGPGLKEGVFLTGTSHPESLRDSIRYALEATKRNISPLYNTVFNGRPFGSPILIGLVIVGLFREAWSRQRLIQEGFLLLVLCFFVALVLQVHGLQFRYAFPVLPFLILWAAKGMEELSKWVKTTTISAGFGSLGGAKRIENAVRWALGIAVLALAVAGTRDVGEFEQANPRHLSVKQAGLWLRGYAPGPKRIMDLGAVIPYYASGSLVDLPYTDSATALRYVARKKPDFIVLNGQWSVQARPYLAEWIENGIPDPRAKLVWHTGDKLEEKVAIYRWTPSKD